MAAAESASRADPSGRYFVGAQLSYGVIGAYVILLLLVIFLVPSSAIVPNPTIAWVLAAVVAFFLARYLSTGYWMDADRVTAFRLVGGRRIRLEEIRRIEFANLRDLSPTGFFGSWGYRGRMWSPAIETFDSVQTSSAGILIWAGAHPLFITPKDPERFIRELSRRVRSWRGPLEIDHGAPAAADGTPPRTPAD